MTETNDILDTVIASANHSPDLVDQIMLVKVLEKVLGWVEVSKQKTQSQEHTQAAGNLRTALRVERSLLNDMMARNQAIGQALRHISGAASDAGC